MNITSILIEKLYFQRSRVYELKLFSGSKPQPLLFSCTIPLSHSTLHFVIYWTTSVLSLLTIILHILGILQKSYCFLVCLQLLSILITAFMEVPLLLLHWFMFTTLTSACYTRNFYAQECSWAFLFVANNIWQNFGQLCVARAKNYCNPQGRT